MMFIAALLPVLNVTPWRVLLDPGGAVPRHVGRPPPGHSATVSSRFCIFGERQEPGTNAGPQARKIGHFRECILAMWGCIRSLNLANYMPFRAAFGRRFQAKPPPQNAEI